MAAESMRIDPRKSSRFSVAACFSRSTYCSMSLAMLLNVSASSLISAAPLTSTRSWNSARLIARVEVTSPRIGRVIPSANKYPNKSATNVAPITNRNASPRQFRHARVNARLFHAPLRHHRPSQRRNRAVSPDHLRRMSRSLIRLEKSNRRRRAQILGQLFELSAPPASYPKDPSPEPSASEFVCATMCP